MEETEWKSDKRRVSLYGEKTNTNEFVISAEVPTKINSDIWKNSENFKDIIWDELKMMDMVGFFTSIVSSSLLVWMLVLIARDVRKTKYKPIKTSNEIAEPIFNPDSGK